MLRKGRIPGTRPFFVATNHVALDPLVRAGLLESFCCEPDAI